MAPDPTPPSAPPSRRMPAGRAIAVLICTLAVSALLSAQDLVHVAQGQAFGTKRDVELSIANDVHRASAFLSLDRPREWLASLTNHTDGPTRTNVSLPPPSTVPSTAASSSTTTSTTRVPHSSTTTSTAPTTTTTLPVRRVPTPAQPVNVLMAGDSLMGNLSDEFIRLVHTDPRIKVSTDVHVSTGLTRPDVLDWPAELQTVVTQRKPDVVVLIFGANDNQPMRDATGHWAGLGTDRWRAEYERRVAQMMDIAGAGGRTVVWVGLPTVARADINTTKDVINAVLHLEASARPRVHIVDTIPLLSPAGGGYADFLPGPDGAPVKVREADGVHVTHAGDDRITPVLYDTFRREWHLDTPWPPSSTTTTTAPPRPPAPLTPRFGRS